MTPFPPLDRTSATFKSDLDLLFLSRLPNFISEANAMQANLNSVAAGGAYAVPMRFDAMSGDVDPGAGVARFLNAQVTGFDGVTKINVSTTNAQNSIVASLIDSWGESSSPVKGHLRLASISDPGKFVLYKVTSVDTSPNKYRSLIVAAISRSDNAWSNGELAILYFQRTGDQGATGIRRAAKFSDRKSAGAAGGGSVAGDPNQQRTLNNIDYVDIPGFQLSNNAISIFGGATGMTLEVKGRAPAYNVSGHKASLYNVTDGVYVAQGSSSAASNGNQTDSVFSTKFTVPANVTKVFVVRHFTQVGVSGSGLGVAVTTGSILETYTEVEFLQVA